jgi:hypothetical protein
MRSESNAVLKVYLGANQAGGYLPFGHAERMSVAYGKDAETKLAQIRKYLEVDHSPSDWSQSDLAGEQKVFEAKLARHFPELDNIAVNSLACRWSYSWK